MTIKEFVVLEAMDGVKAEMASDVNSGHETSRYQEPLIIFLFKCNR